MQNEQKHTLIVGSGLAGTALAIRMLHYATEPQQITLLEERDDYRHGGVSYSAQGAGWEHVFNIQAGRMSVFREDTEDFINWANSEADRTGWPDDWKNVRFHESSAAPRRIYPQYLKTRLEQAQANAADNVKLHVTQGMAVDLVEHEDSYADVDITDYRESDGTITAKKTIAADQVVLATGHEEQEPNAPSVDTMEFNNKQVKHVRRLYSPKGRQSILDVDTNATVYIKGSFLTSYDAAITLLKNGHKGYIVFDSRSGNHPWDYPKNHKHGVIRLPVPEFVKQDLPIGERIDLAFQELDETLQANAKPGASIQENNVLVERVLKAWEPHIATLIQKLPADEARAFTSEVLSEFGHIRIGLTPEASDIIKKAMTMTENNTFPQAMDIQDVDVLLHTHAQLLKHKWHADPSVAINQIHASINNPELIIDNMPRQSDYSKVQNPLWRKLIDEHKAAIPHIKTGQGVRLDTNYHLVNAAGKASELVYVTGIPAEGHERETKGRIGPFAFNVAAVKDQSFLIANHILDAAQHARSQPTKHVITASDRTKSSPATEPAIAKVTAGYLAFFAAKIKRDRESARQTINGEASSLARKLRATDLDERAAEALVSEVKSLSKTAALNQFTDITITPRELAANLKRHLQ